MSAPLCFVLMPFGKKPDFAGMLVNFDAVYRDLITPAIKEAGLCPVRADEEMSGGIIHTPMFERLIFCEYAIADLTTANANVFYELGLRHAVRPWSTILIFSKGGSQLPFDVAPLRGIPYPLSPDGTPADLPETRALLSRRLEEARKAARDKPMTDSPIFQLVDGYPSAIDHAKTDVFRDQVRYSLEKKDQIAEARKEGVDALRALEQSLPPIDNLESAVIIDLFLSYRDHKAWDEMVGLVEKMPKPLAGTVLVQEQLAVALNRAGRGEDAEKVLTNLLERRGPSSETLGLLGRVYKDRWEAALKKNEKIRARGLLDKAIGAYLQGFEADWRDAYPGINAATLMELKEPPDPRRLEIIPVVTYAVRRRIASGKPDYWDHATLVELAALAEDESGAVAALADSLAVVRGPWEPETTARNLRLIRETRERRNQNAAWIAELEQELLAAAQRAQ